MAFLAFREGYTFSDKIAPTYWSSFCRGILDSQTDTVGCDKMMLGAQNNISGFSQRSYFSIRSGFASKKEGATSYPASSCCPSQVCTARCPRNVWHRTATHQRPQRMS